ncbi:MAG: ABC transporter substrate-binding protein, partial [Acidimicrobiia bacterium]
DRGAIEDYMDGDCEAATQLYPRDQVGHDPDLDDQFTHDPERARRLLAEAGFPDGVDLQLATIAGQSPYEALAAIIQEQLANVGIRVEILRADAASLTQQFAAGDLDMATGAMMGTPPDPGEILTSHFLGVQNLAQGVAPEMADLAVAGQDRTGPSEGWQTRYREAARIAGEKALYMPICNGKAQYLMTSKVGGFDEMPGQSLFGSVEARALWMKP